MAQRACLGGEHGRPVGDIPTQISRTRPMLEVEA